MRTRIWHSDWKPRWLIRCVSAALLSFMDKQERVWCNRRVVGWSMANHLRTRLGLDALDMALWQRQPDGVIHHSDSEYAGAGSLGVT